MAVTDQMAEDVEVAQTFVFLDIETTNLPHLNFGKANITELAMWTISREDLISVEKPRLLNKWTMNFNPAMMVHPESTRITGLCNELLEKYNKLDENAGKALISYLSHFPKPVCLVAHNGNKFDFPIIKKSLEKIGLVMPDFIYCSDSLLIIRELDGIEQERSKAADAAKCDDNTTLSISHTQNEPALEESAQSMSENAEEGNELFDHSNKTIKERQRLNETTPRRSPQTKFNKKNTQIRNGSGKESVSTCKARKELFPPLESGKWKSNKEQRKSFKLGDIYKRIFGTTLDGAHEAEADVSALYNIVKSKYKRTFTEASDKMSIRFSDIKTNGLK